MDPATIAAISTLVKSLGTSAAAEDQKWFGDGGAVRDAVGHGPDDAQGTEGEWISGAVYAVREVA